MFWNGTRMYPKFRYTHTLHLQGSTALLVTKWYWDSGRRRVRALQCVGELVKQVRVLVVAYTNSWGEESIYWVYHKNEVLLKWYWLHTLNGIMHPHEWFLGRGPTWVSCSEFVLAVRMPNLPVTCCGIRGNSYWKWPCLFDWSFLQSAGILPMLFSCRDRPFWHRFHLLGRHLGVFFNKKLSWWCILDN